MKNWIRIEGNAYINMNLIQYIRFKLHDQECEVQYLNGEMETFKGIDDLKFTEFLNILIESED